MNFETRADLEKILDQFGIKSGSLVLLQADMEKLDRLIGRETTILETILDKIGPKGVLIVPAFTMAALDPVHLQNLDASLEDWDEIRKNHPGYSSRTMPADVWPEIASAFLLHTKVKRTEHPVYSFAWLGPLFYKPALDTLDYPVSFSHILCEMKRKNAVNLLIGVNPQSSLMPLMVAHEKNLDITGMQSAFVRRVKKTFEESFLISELDENGLLEAGESLEVDEARLGQVPVYQIRLKQNQSEAV